MEITRKRETLKLIARRTKEGKQTSFRSLVREFWISEEAACGRLRRLWNERLIECAGYRPAGYEFRPDKGESIRDLSFQVSCRGRERLEWYEDQERREQEEGW